MPKNFPAALQAHLQQEVISIASCWKITRKDGTVFYFTDHDRDLTVAGNVYEAASGYGRTTVVTRADLSADNLEVHGILTSPKITDEALRAGLFDRAAVEIFIVNWADPDGTGVGKIRKGTLGEAMVHEGRYVIELRGLSQALTTQIAEVYTPDCRADLFDLRCGLAAAAFKETAEVLSVVSKRQFVLTVNKTIRRVPDQPGAETYGAQIGADGKVRLLLNDIPDGTPERPYLISTPANLDDVRLNPYAHYALIADVDMVAFGFFTPIPSLWGSIDGRGFKIQNINLSHAGATLTGMISTLRSGAILRRIGMTSPTVANGSSATYKAPFAGSVSAGALVEFCYAEGGTVTTDGDRAGGLVGAVIAGGTIHRCYAAVVISGAVGGNAGGFLGNAQVGAVLTLCYFDTTIATTSVAGAGAAAVVGLITAQAQLQASYTGWDFANAWKIAGGTDWPRHLDPGR